MEERVVNPPLGATLVPDGEPVDVGSPVEISDEYRRAIARVEAFPENQSGADKTWVEVALREYHDDYARAVRVR